MKILINADKSVGDYDALTVRVDGVVRAALRHLSDRITRVEVHLADENGAKEGGEDKRCMMEARLEGRQPVAVTSHGDSFDAAVHDAATSLAKTIDSALARVEARRGTHDANV